MYGSWCVSVCVGENENFSMLFFCIFSEVLWTQKRGQRANVGPTNGDRRGRLSHEPVSAGLLMDLPATVQVFFSVGPRHEIALFRSDTPVDQIKGIQKFPP